MTDPTPLQRLNRYAERTHEMGAWENAAVLALRRTLTNNPDARGAKLGQIIRAAYPFGQRKHYPYKAWRRVVREALGLAAIERRKKRDAQDAASTLFDPVKE